MPNKRYNKGRSFEYLARQELEADGFFVIRSAGSKGPIDLVAIDVNQTKLIQIKSTTKKFSNEYFKGDIQKLEDLKRGINYSCRIEFWIRRNKKWNKTIVME